ncbi:MAG: hypothetical protein WBQ72_11925 [Terriglobales bacterium]
MNPERLKILEMLAAGKITAADADKLLDKIAGSASTENRAESKSAARPETASENKPADGAPPKPRFLRILVDKPGHDQVNVRMPLGLMRTGTNFLAVLPTEVREKLSERGVDVAALGSLNAREWSDLVDNLNIDIEKGDGKKVKIFCE